MAVIQLSPAVLRLGIPVPVALRDAAGQLLLPRGTVLNDEAQRQQLIARGLYVDAGDSEQFRKALAGKLDAMVRGNALLGQIASALPDALAGAAVPAKPASDPITAWQGMMLRASALLHDAPPSDFASRVQQLDRDVLGLLDTDADASLLVLIHGTTSEVHQYSVTHALLVVAVCELAARHLDWPADWRPPLRRAALTMNLAMTELQDQLALQETPVTPRQREQIDGHAWRAAEQMRKAGVDDVLWLDAVEHHHSTQAGPLAELPPMLQLARLIQRADIFAARLSPRKARPAMSATAAAKAAYLDENQQADEAGSAIVKALGIYPPGSCVRLASGEVGVVVRRGRRANEPVVASVIGRSGAPCEPAVRDTRQPGFAIGAGVAPHEVKLRLNPGRLLQLVKPPART